MFDIMRAAPERRNGGEMHGGEMQADAGRHRQAKCPRAGRHLTLPLLRAVRLDVVKPTRLPSRQGVLWHSRAPSVASREGLFTEGAAEGYARGVAPPPGHEGLISL